MAALLRNGRLIHPLTEWGDVQMLLSVAATDGDAPEFILQTSADPTTTHPRLHFCALFNPTFEVPCWLLRYVEARRSPSMLLAGARRMPQPSVTVTCCGALSSIRADCIHNPTSSAISAATRTFLDGQGRDQSLDWASFDELFMVL